MLKDIVVFSYKKCEIKDGHIATKNKKGNCYDSSTQQV